MTMQSDDIDQLIGAGRLRAPRVWRAALGDPPVAAWRRDRVEGMLLGLAVGDALGNTTEGQLPGERRVSHGEIRDYLPNRYFAHQAKGLPSDDSQMAFWTLECLLEHGRIVPDHLADAFTRRRIFGIGHSVRAFVGAYKAGGGNDDGRVFELIENACREWG